MYRLLSSTVHVIRGHMHGHIAARVALFVAIVLSYAGSRLPLGQALAARSGSVLTVRQEQPSAAPGSRVSAIQGAVVQMTAPAQVQLGQPITLTLSVANARNLAGYETTLLFDPHAAHFSGVQQRQDGLRAVGRGVAPLGPVTGANGVAFGLYSCPVANCVRTSAGTRVTGGGQGTVTLAVLEIVSDKPGLLDLRLGRSLFVDAQGVPLPVTVATPLLSVQVGAAGAGPHYTAPGAAASVELAPSASTPVSPTATSAAAAPAAPGRYDLSGDGTVTYADAAEVALAWTTAREAGQPCGHLAQPQLDLNHDGCIDVADAQLVAAHYSTASAISTARQIAATRVALTTGQAGTGPMTYTVNSTGDADDANPGDGVCATTTGVCTLRAAIEEADQTQGTSYINFNIPGTGVQTIQLQYGLPTLSNQAGPIIIDGYTQPGASPNTSPITDNAQIRVQIAWGGQQGQNVFNISSAGNIIRGLSIYDVGRPVLLYGPGATNNVIAGDFIGTDATGTFAMGQDIYTGDGVDVSQGATGNTIGGTDPADRNVISGNGLNGVYITDEGTDHNAVYNNIIGLSPDGTRAVPNYTSGIHVASYASHNLIGGTAPGQGNVSSGNGGEGIELSHGELTVGNLVLGNYLGTDPTGNAAPAYTANAFNGVELEDGIRNNIVADNVIGNDGAGCCNNGGITIHGVDYAEGNQVYHNWIGVSPNGTPIPNSNWGIGITTDSQLNTIGPDNVIADNPIGVWVQDATAVGNTITRNAIFGNQGLGIDLAPTGENPNQTGAQSGPNDDLNHPVLSTATPASVTGTACVTCTVEVFVADGAAGAYGQGETFVGAGPVNPDGTFTVALTGTVPPGAYVTASATDATGDTSEFAPNLVVSAPSGTGTPPPASATAAPSATATSCPAIVAADSFSRVVGHDDWGRADIGGVYGLNKPVQPAPDNKYFAVNGTAGTMVLSTTASVGEAYLTDVSAQDVDIVARVAVNQLPVGEDVYAWLAARRATGGTEYRGRIALAQGTVSVGAARTADDAIYDLSPSVSTGVTYSANSYVWARMEVVGTNPTTIRMKAWADGQPEPATWAYTTTDATPALQGPGAVGLVATLGVSVTNAPIQVSFDDLQVTDLQAPACTPTATPVATSTLAPTATSTPTSTATSTPTSAVTSTPQATATSSATSAAMATPTATPAASTILAADTFNRTVSNGWGSADIGGAYTLSGSAGDFAVTGATGTISLSAPSANRAAYLPNVSAQDVDETVRVQTNKVATGSGQYIYVLARANLSGTEYRGKLRIDSTGQVYLQATKVLTNVETNLGSEVAVPGLLYTPGTGTYLDLRLRVTGTNPTTLQMMAWPDGQPEPTTWAYSVTDNEPLLQGAGAVGLRAYLAGKATNAPVLVSFAGYQVSAPSSSPTTTSTPTATATTMPQPTATNTPQATATSTPANTSTTIPQATATMTPTTTATATPPASATSTAQATVTNTNTPTNTAQPIATNTPTNTPQAATATTPPTATATTPPASATSTSTPTTTPRASATSAPTATATATSTPLALDTFNRTVSNGWGSADIGGAYTLSGSAGDFAVTGSTGTINLTVPGANRAAYLRAVSATQLDATVRVQLNKVATGSGQYLYLLARANTGAGTEYRGKLRIDSTGQVYLQATKVLTNAETNLGSEIAVPGLIYTPGTGTYLHVRLLVTGTNPTTLQMMAWPDGQPEPTTWAYSVTDNEPLLQGAGAVGLRAYLAGKATNAPVLVSFAGYQVTVPSSPSSTASMAQTPRVQVTGQVLLNRLQSAPHQVDILSLRGHRGRHRRAPKSVTEGG